MADYAALIRPTRHIHYFIIREQGGLLSRKISRPGSSYAPLQFRKTQRRATTIPQLDRWRNTTVPGHV